ncbi:MAG: hypothetical protein Q9168_002494 [Polycauliona sp. 1 TL-2023]
MLSIRWIIHSSSFHSFIFLPTVYSTPVGGTHHLSPNPLNILNDNIDLCSNYATCAANGYNSWTTLHQTITQNLADRASSFADFQEWYETDTVPLGSYGKTIRQDLTNHGIPWQKMVLYASTSRDAETAELSVDSAYGNIIDPIQGVIVAIENWRHLDESALQLPWSEIIYLTWRYIAAAHSPTTKTSLATLRYSVQNNVDNDDTRRILRLMYAQMGFAAPGTGDAVWRAWTPESVKTRNWFLALSGTDNCKGTVWLLRDHAVEARGKAVRVIWTRWADFYPDIWMDIE